MKRRLSLCCSAPSCPVAVILLFALVPWVWMMLSSFRPESDLTHSPMRLMPDDLDAGQPHRAAGAHQLPQNLRDSVVVAAGAVALGLDCRCRRLMRSRASAFRAATRCGSSSW